MIFIRLQEFDYPAASAVASVILLVSLVLLFSINGLQSRFGKRLRTSSDIAQQRSLYRRQIDWVKWGLILTGVVLSILFLVVPIAWIFMTAFSKGIEIFTDNLLDSDMLHAVWLTLLIRFNYCTDKYVVWY